MTGGRLLSDHARLVAIVQARMSSTRMPGKVLESLAGRSALEQLVRRATAVARIDEVVLATSSDGSDDRVAVVGEELGIRVVRGPLDDVLARFRTAANEAKADVIVRLTADCPMHDPDVIRLALAVAADAPATVEYLSNAVDRTYPAGLDVEVCSSDALNDAHASAKEAYDREHVMPWIVRNRPCRSFVQEQDLSALCWTLDHPEDHEFLSAAFDALASNDRIFGAADVYRWLLDNPDRLWTGITHPIGTEERNELLTRVAAQLRADAVRAWTYTDGGARPGQTHPSPHGFT